MEARKVEKQMPRVSEILRKVPKPRLQIVKLEERIAPRLPGSIPIGTSNVILFAE